LRAPQVSIRQQREGSALPVVDPRMKVNWGRPLSMAMVIRGNAGWTGEMRAGKYLTACTKKQIDLILVCLAVSDNGSKVGGSAGG
jgi:hypothetical protein